MRMIVIYKKRLKQTLLFLAVSALMVIYVVTWRHGDHLRAESAAGEAVQAAAATDGLAERLAGVYAMQAPDSEDEAMKRLDRMVTRFLRKWEINGASLAVARNGKLVYTKGYGYADVERSVPMTPGHVMRIASVSKLITAVGVMQLYEAGKLGLDDRVFGQGGILNDSIFGEIRDKRVRTITVDHLLRHRGGFSLRAGDPMFNTLDVARAMGVAPPADANTIIRYALRQRLGFMPGQSTSYSNLGYVILSKVIEKISGQPYEQYIREHVLDPLGCVGMCIGHNTYIHRLPNEVRYYCSPDDEPVPACDGSGRMVLRCYEGNDIECLSGAGGWVASPAEILRIVDAIDGEHSMYRLLRPETVRLMTEARKDELPIGWMRTNERGDWWRTGTLSGTSAMLKRQHDGITWMLVTNTSSWKGSRFPGLIDGMMRDALASVERWPDVDRFAERPLPVAGVRIGPPLSAGYPGHTLIPGLARPGFFRTFLVSDPFLIP
ncbi:MAG: beta-lactamase family protein [Rikenellaceae bacterium]|nr:beta-lactamase family protein [Rikenellaceae bacterium]